LLAFHHAARFEHARLILAERSQFLIDRFAPGTTGSGWLAVLGLLAIETGARADHIGRAARYRDCRRIHSDRMPMSKQRLFRAFTERSPLIALVVAIIGPASAKVGR
jgi:hypothetical protein